MTQTSATTSGERRFFDAFGEKLIMDDQTPKRILAVGRGAKIGYDTNIGENFSCERGVVIYPKATIGNNVTIGERALIGWSFEIRTKELLLPVTIGDDVTIGNRALIEAGSNIPKKVHIAPHTLIISAINEALLDLRPEDHDRVTSEWIIKILGRTGSREYRDKLLSTDPHVRKRSIR